MKPVFERTLITTSLISTKSLTLSLPVFLNDVEDIRQCRRYQVSDALLNARFLPEHTMYFAAAITDKDITEFRCCKLKQLNAGLYPY